MQRAVEINHFEEPLEPETEDPLVVDLYELLLEVE